MLLRYLHQPTFQIHKFLSTLSASKTSVQTEFNTLFNKKSKANSSIEKGRNLTAEEEQELIYEGPGTIAFDKIPTVTKTATNQYTYDYKQAASHVLSSGLCHFPNILNVNTAEQLRLHTNVVLESSKQNVVDGKDKYLNLFGPIMSRNNRYDVLLPLDATVLDAVTEILLQIEPTMQELLGNDSYLCEMSALISDPNAVAQPIHHDTSFDGTPPRVSLLIALQDVDEDMGPTIFFPATNTPEWHIKYLMRGEELENLLCNTKHVTGTLKAGDAILYDTHLLHCASENVSKDKRRTLLTLSAQEENKDNKKEKSNIKKKYRKKLQLKDINNWQTDE